MKQRTIRIFLTLTVVLALMAGCKPSPTPTPVPEVQKLILATTTSTADSGLLDYLLPEFEAQYNAKVEVIAVGTGQAIKTAEQGDADVILVHDRAKEDKFVAEGYGVNRQDVMYNDFVIVGPKEDPASIKGLTDAAAALAKIAAAQAPFASRGDESGTHSKEKTIWAQAGIEPGGDWYFSLGQGMGETLTFANEKGAHALTDRGTYLSRREGLELLIVVEGDPILFNPYGVIAVNPEKHPHVKYDLAMKFIEWLTSVETQKKIGEFGIERFGQPLFYPSATK
ncbi:MAG: extracellular solute-binding protein [Chloroflexi bacterium]|nr:extracellular solute-binding protein [Chloroflexota bacterium]